MVFSSSIFIFVFLPLVLFLYYISGKKLKNYVLLLASLFFYSWGGVSYLKILIVSIIINYIFGILIDDVRSNIKLRKIFLRLGIILNLALLFYYKYYDFTIENINEIFNTNYSIKNIYTYENAIKKYHELLALVDSNYKMIDLGLPSGTR